LEENAFLVVAVLVSVQDVPLTFEDPAGHARHEAALIRPVQQGDERRDGFGHVGK